MLRSWTLLALGLALAGCGESTPDPHEEEGACGEISEACHGVDTGTGAIAECHDVAHEGVLTACEEREAECVALCQAAAGDGGAHDHDHDAGAEHEDHDAGE
jgi:hypothetical protein